MKRLTLSFVVGITMLLLSSCQKQHDTFIYSIASSVSIDYKSQQTLVSFSSTFEQDGIDDMPEGNALLIMSATQDMNVSETLCIAKFPFHNGNGTFSISASQRPFDKNYWYFIELQAPLSLPLRSERYVMPASPVIDPDIPELVFLTENGEYVRFAQGNLQYKASTDTWRFADHQYDIIGQDNQNISPSYDGYIDLFGYGTSGYSYKPYSSALNKSDYATSDISNTQDDWGVYCSISNGGGYEWYTLSSSDWVYIYSGRPDADQKRSHAIVNGVKGLILLPEIWSTPSDCAFTPDAPSYNVNIYSVVQWQAMENAGAVFLPAAGYRIETTIYGTDEGDGNYHSSSWTKQGTSTEGNNYCAQPLRFVFNGSNVFSHAIYSGTDVYGGYGSAVRLVRKVQK